MKKQAVQLVIGLVAVVASQCWGVTIPEPLYTYPDLQLDSASGAYVLDQMTGVGRFTCGNPYAYLSLFTQSGMDTPFSEFPGSALLGANIDMGGSLVSGPEANGFYVQGMDQSNFFQASLTDFYMPSDLTYIFMFTVTAAGGDLANYFGAGSTGYVNFTDLIDPPFSESFEIPYASMDIHGSAVPDQATTGCLLGLACMAMVFVRRLSFAR